LNVQVTLAPMDEFWARGEGGPAAPAALRGNPGKIRGLSRMSDRERYHVRAENWAAGFAVLNPVRRHRPDARKLLGRRSWAGGESTD